MTTPITPPTLNVYNIEQSDVTPNHKHPLYELLSEVFVVPAVYAQTTILVELASQYHIGMWIWIQGAGNYLVTGIPDSTHIYVKNLGGDLNTDPGTTVAIGSVITVSSEPAEESTVPDVVLYDVTTQVFTTPAAGGSASMYLEACSDWAEVGMVIYVDGSGWYEITAVDSVAERITVENADDENPAGGTSVATDTKVFPCPAPRGPTMLSGVVSACDPTPTSKDETIGAVVFTTAFDEVPVVTVSYEPNPITTALTGVLVVFADSITVNGFNIKQSNVSLADVNIDVHWTACIPRNV